MHIEHARRPGVRSAVGAALAVASTACAPTLDWREARLDGSGVAMLFPCRPQLQERKVPLGGAIVPMRMHACSAGGANFALAAVDIADPAKVTPELAALRAQMVANLAGTATAQPLSLARATPNPESARVRIVGRRPDGSRVVADAAFFVKGLTLYQATILGSDDVPGREAVDTFFGAIRLP